MLFPAKAEQDRDCRNGLSPEEEGEHQLLPQDRPGADLGADLIVMIGGHAKGQVPGPELLEQSRTERKGLGEMGMVREEPSGEPSNDGFNEQLQAMSRQVFQLEEAVASRDHLIGDIEVKFTTATRT